MDNNHIYFEFHHASAQSGTITLTIKQAATLLRCTHKTAKKHLDQPETADMAKMAYLRARATRTIIPPEWGLWIDYDTEQFWTDTGYSFTRSELSMFGFLREIFHARAAIDKPAKIAESRPSNVIDFSQILKTRKPNYANH